jgi:hypothetical protein
LSRSETRYPAKKTAKQIFANSAGWKEKPTRRIQMRAPLIVLPSPGTMGRSRSPIPTKRDVHVYRLKAR